jgi:hypothetical protein
VARLGTAPPPPVPTPHGAYVIAVVTEGRQRTVGVAATTVGAAHTFDLVQLVDNQSYSQTLALLHSLGPAEIVVPRSMAERALFQKIVSLWGDVAAVSAINRSYFDETAGEALVRRLSLKPLPAAVLAAKYVAVACAHAAVRYIEAVMRVTFLPASLLWVVREPAGRMVSASRLCACHPSPDVSCQPHAVRVGGGGRGLARRRLLQLGPLPLQGCKQPPPAR